MIKAPFTNEQVQNLNNYQGSGIMHPFTCEGQMTEFTDSEGTFMQRSREHCPNDGILIATKEGWACPCGKYKQHWAHEFMANKVFIEEFTTKK